MMSTEVDSVAGEELSVRMSEKEEPNMVKSDLTGQQEKGGEIIENAGGPCISNASLIPNTSNEGQISSAETIEHDSTATAIQCVEPVASVVCTEPEGLSLNGFSREEHKGDGIGGDTLFPTSEQQEMKNINSSSDFASDKESSDQGKGADEKKDSSETPLQSQIENQSQSIYLTDDMPASKQDKPVSKPQKRLTRAEKAAMEALAAFGGSDFGSLSVRKIDLQHELKVEAEMWKKSEKEESSRDDTACRPQKRLQKAREEVKQQFKDIALGEGKRKYPKIAMAKQKAKLEEKEKVTVKYQTRLQKSKAYSSEAFGGQSLDKLEVKRKEKMKSAHLTKDSTSDNSKPESGSSLARALKPTDKAKLEAIQKFGGDSLDKVLSNTRKRVARHFDAYPTKKPKLSEDAIEEDETEVPAAVEGKENSDVKSSDIEAPAN